MNTNTRKARCFSRARALTLVECVISLLIVAVALGAAINSVGAARKSERRMEDSRRAATLANDLLAEICAQQYRDSADSATVFGPTVVEGALGTRAIFNDVNDYRNFTENPPRAKDGASLAYDSGWTRSVLIDFVSPSSPDAASATDQGLARITVRVTRNQSQLASVSTYASLGLPATESCRLPSGTLVNLVPAHCQSLGGTSGGEGSNCWTISEQPPTGLGLVARWQMDESSGVTAVDIAGGHNATLTNGPTFIAGQFGNALKLDGVNDYAEVPDAPALSIGGSITLAAWVYLDTIPGSTSYFTVLHKGTTTTTRNYFLQLFGSQLSFGYRDTLGLTIRYSFGSVSKTKKWYHVAATYDSAALSAKLYIDGALVQTFVAATAPATNTGALTIGKSPYGDYLKGRIDDARIYGRALSATEIELLVSGGEP